MKLQKAPVLVAAFFVAMASPALWAHGPGGRGGGGCRGGGGWHGGGGWRGGGGSGWCGRGPCGRFGGWRGGCLGSFSIASGGGYGAPIWGGYGGYGGYGGCGYGAPCMSYTPCTPYPYAMAAPQPSYYVNYSPYITTGAAPVAPVAVAPVAESTGCALVSGDLIGNVQRALRQRGFYNGCIDGVSGPPTRAAIRAYAASCGWTSSGIIDAQLLKSLGIM